MDPDEALLKLREAVKKYKADTECNDAADVLCDTFEDLDQWLSNGGFPPGDWHWQNKREQEARGEGT